ncbi:MAG: hypothetical protein K0A89_06450 [ANME-2 cluster archaeon]|nr:hypothetical protein [ANME-2 cluster archaeon]
MTTNNLYLHLKNIYKKKELDELATAEDFSTVQNENNSVRASFAHTAEINER